MKFSDVPLVEYLDIPKELHDILKNYYSETDQRIPNDSYTRYPYQSSDLDEALVEGYHTKNDFDNWLCKGLGYIPSFIIIHWDW
jgi:hypothetical protein